MWFGYPIYMTFQNICDLDIQRKWHLKIFVQKSKNIWQHWQGYAVLNYLHLRYPCHIYGIWRHNFFQIGYPCHISGIWQMCKRCERVWVFRCSVTQGHDHNRPAVPVGLHIRSNPLKTWKVYQLLKLMPKTLKPMIFFWRGKWAWPGRLSQIFDGCQAEYRYLWKKWLVASTLITIHHH